MVAVPTTMIALLRGVNVGGHGKLSMDRLRQGVADLGYEDVRTYIQSGNVVFTTGRGGPPSAVQLERDLSAALGGPVSLVLRTAAELASVVEGNPYPARHLAPATLHVTFLAEAPAPERAAALEIPAGVDDELTLAGQDVYLHCPGGYGRTKLHNGFLERRLGVAATTRGWQTVLRLAQMAGG